MEDLQILAKQWLHQGIEFVLSKETTKFFNATYVLFLAIIMLFFHRLFRPKKTNIVLFSGLSGSGKTMLFNRLRDRSSHRGVVTSMEPNEGTSVLHTKITMVEKDLHFGFSGITKPVHLLDVPGHSPKLEEYLPLATALVFVVDAMDFLPNCRAASEYLYDILTNASVVTNKIPVLLCCNKTDKVTAYTKDFISKQMEKQIEKLRVSRIAISTVNDFTLGIEGEVFSFSHCQNKVTLAESSGLTGETDQVQEFIREHVKP
ncbi:Signal recognition particle receptor beta subunit [Arabidopsis suecica]|uniref:Signal recognition particle receptor beta subunit n=1 Tax=Arabidopsis suecica TaxID=45249 RepID=A0A8T1Z890_ARASU|nr:Signal recognition particle receptor beta subunit [Arabidopsis suecica]